MRNSDKETAMKMTMTSVVAKVNKVKLQIASELTSIAGVTLEDGKLVFAPEQAAQLAAACKQIFLAAKQSRKYDRAHVAGELWQGFASVTGSTGWRPGYHHGSRA